MDDPLTDQLQMRAIHKWRFWFLFDNKGQPQILFRRRRTTKDAKGISIIHLDVEWGDLNHGSFTPETKKMFTDAWNEYQDWKKAMA